MTQLPIFCICGPTASGKTAAALEIAQRFPIEIISMDSALVYREMDIGTAKPSLSERAQTPHHLIDILDPLEAYSAAHFRQDALQLIEQILQRQRIPLIIGGTMLYFKALSQGLSHLPDAHPEIRAALDQLALQHGWEYLYKKLQTIDPVTAKRLSPHDAQRIQRALEVFEVTQQPLSELIKNTSRPTSPYHFKVISLEPSDRSVLHERIAKRFDLMLEMGLINEVEKLYQRGDLNSQLPSIRCVGYRQAWEYLSGTIDFNTMRDKSIFATRQLCKRQLTWLRAIENKHVFDACNLSCTKQIIDYFSSFRQM